MRKYVLLLGLVLSFEASAASEGWKNCDDEGTANCEYQIKDGVLTIRGTGENGAGTIPDYSRDCSMTRYHECTTPAPWKWDENANTVTSLKIENGITSIGEDAFEDMPFTTAQLPDTLTSIKEKAFIECNTLSSVNLPNQLRDIGNSAFAGTVLMNVVIPEGTEENPTIVGNAAFRPRMNAGYDPVLMESFVVGDNTILDENALMWVWESKKYTIDLSALTMYCASGNTSCTAALEAAYNAALQSGNIDGSKPVSEYLKTYTKTADGYYQIGDELYGSADMMPKGADYSCGATTSICSTVLSEVGGANCDTIKSCRNLAEMADENVYCNSMSTCKELTDLVGGENCDSLESCKALSDMAASGEYCTTVAECKALNDMVGGENCDSLESCKALSDMANENQYCSTVAECKALNDMVGGENCDSLESCKALSDMAASGEYCSTVEECKRFMDLMNSGYCEGFEACKEMFNASVINYDGKRYGSLEDLYNGNALPSITRQEQGDGSFAVYKDGVFAGYKGKRIYTMEEANRVTKPMGNTLKIKYR